MKKQYYVISALMMLSVFAATGKQNQAEAAEKKTKLEQGTLTISGKGAMPENLKVKNKNKVKKVVIKRVNTIFIQIGYFTVINGVLFIRIEH